MNQLVQPVLATEKKITVNRAASTCTRAEATADATESRPAEQAVDAETQLAEQLLKHVAEGRGHQGRLSLRLSLCLLLLRLLLLLLRLLLRLLLHLLREENGVEEHLKGVRRNMLRILLLMWLRLCRGLRCSGLRCGGLRCTSRAVSSSSSGLRLRLRRLRRRRRHELLKHHGERIEWR